MGLFSKKSNPEREQRAAAEPDAPVPAGAAAQQLPAEGPLRRLVDGLLADGSQSAKLTLVQRGSTMSYQSERAEAGAAAQTDAGTVDQASPLFDDVAALYTESMNAPSGAWQTAVIAVGAQGPGAREVTVDYDFPNAPHSTQSYELGQGRAAGDETIDTQSPAGTGVRGGGQDSSVATGAAEDIRDQDHAAAVPGSQDRTAVAADAHHPEQGGPAGQTAQVTQTGQTVGGSDTAAAGAGLGAGAAAGAASHGRQDEAARETGADRTGGEDDLADEVRARRERDKHAFDDDAAPQGSDRQGSAAQAAPASEPTAASDAGATTGAGHAQAPVDPAQQERVPEGQLTDEGAVDNLAARQQGQEPIIVDREVQHSVAQTTGQQNTEGDAGVADGGRSGSVPSHVDHDEWHDDLPGPRPAASSAPTGAAAARSAGGPDEGDAPTLASAADVAPSYRAAEATDDRGQRLAQGNRVLSEQDVLRRLSGAQKHLFGAEGTARDVSTVLIRVRTLGTYYDALTHVRQGGFWDQRPTFNLVPEDQLQVQSLKQDSYVEGEGAPLAIMFRFRAGIPPEISFDYDDEEAFVHYETRLPSQNYVEELRMYPRTGSNIPQHVDDALQDWNY